MKISKVTPLEDYILHVVFDNQVSKMYDVKPLFNKWQVFNDLKKTICLRLFVLITADMELFGMMTLIYLNTKFGKTATKHQIEVNTHFIQLINKYDKIPKSKSINCKIK